MEPIVKAETTTATSNKPLFSPEDHAKRKTTEIFVSAMIVFFLGMVLLSLCGVIAEIVFGMTSEKNLMKATDHLISLHNIAGICLSVMILAVLLPVKLPSRVSSLLSVRLPRNTDHKPGFFSQFLRRVLIPLLDVNNDGKMQWFELWTGVAVWMYSFSLFACLAYLITHATPTVRFIQLGAGMTRPVATILVKGYFSVDAPKPPHHNEGPRAWLAWMDVNHDGRLTKIDMFCGGITLVYALLQCFNTVQCLYVPSTRDILEQLIALPLLVVTLAALACFGPNSFNVPLFQMTAVIYMLLIFWFVVRVAWEVDTDQIGGWLDCLLKVTAGMASATMQLVSTFLSKAIIDPPDKIS